MSTSQSNFVRVRSGISPLLPPSPSSSTYPMLLMPCLGILIGVSWNECLFFRSVTDRLAVWTPIVAFSGGIDDALTKCTRMGEPDNTRENTFSKHVIDKFVYFFFVMRPGGRPCSILNAFF